MKNLDGNEQEGIFYLRHFPQWLQWAEPHWHETDGGGGFFGAGTGAVLDHSATAGYLAACAALAAGPELLRAQCHIPLAELTRRAAAALRFILAGHVSRAGRTPDVQAWGRHWGSPIVLERMANLVDCLEPWLPEAERDAWRAVLEDEADFLLTVPVETNRFGLRAETHGERNYWRGSLLFRAARLYPDHPRAAEWLERSSLYCLNALSMPEDAVAETLADGRPLRDWHVGANMHPGALFEHHGVLSLDYSIIAESFFVMAMIGVLRHGWAPTQALSHHMGDLWRFVRKCILPEGRIVCFGKQRPRYTIMYHYALASLVFWARHGGDPGAWDLARALEREAEIDRAASGDGSFHGARGEGLRLLRADSRPYYYFRLEADAILARSYAWLLLTSRDALPACGPTCGRPPRDDELSDPVVSQDAGLVMRRHPRALYAVYWNRSEKAEADPALGLVIPAGHGHRADWLSNLATIYKPLRARHLPRGWRAELCGGGFVTAGMIHEGMPAPGDDGTAMLIDQRLVFAMLPDGRAMLRIEIARARRPVRLLEIAGLNLNLANDIFTGHQFDLISDAGARRVPGLGGADEEAAIASPWVCLPGELGIVAAGSAPPPFVLATAARRRRAYETLLVERLYWPLHRTARLYAEGELILDTAVWLIPGATADETRAFHAGLCWQSHAAEADLLLKTFICFGQPAGLLVNLSEAERTVGGDQLAPLAGLAPVNGGTPAAGITLLPWQGLWFNLKEGV